MTGSVILVVILVLIAVLVGIPALSMLHLARRAAKQRVRLHDGELTIVDSASGRATSIPVDRIDGVVIVHGYGIGLGFLVSSNPTVSYGIWTWGGLLILDATGRVVRHVTSIPGADLPLSEIAARIPATVRREVRSRHGMRAAFPGSLGFFQLRGPGWWWLVLTPLAIVVIAAVVVVTVMVAILQGAAIG
jgi:hypothetical protein